MTPSLQLMDSSLNGGAENGPLIFYRRRFRKRFLPPTRKRTERSRLPAATSSNQLFAPVNISNDASSSPSKLFDRLLNQAGVSRARAIVKLKKPANSR